MDIHSGIFNKEQFERFLKENTISQQKEYITAKPELRILIEQQARNYLKNMESLDSEKSDLKLKAWLLLPKSESKSIKLEDISINASFSNELLQTVLETREYWRINQLKKSGLDLDEITGGMLLHRFCDEGNLEGIKKILKSKVDIDAFDQNGLTPLHLALRKGHVEIGRFLISKGADLLAEDLNFKTPLHYLCENGEVDVALDLYQLFSAKMTPINAIEAATQNNLVEIAKRLIDQHSDAFPYASSSNGVALFQCLMNSFPVNLKVLNYVKDKGVKIENLDPKPFIDAMVSSSDEEFIEFLWDLETSGEGKINLFLEAVIHKAPVENIKLLIDKGFDVNQKNIRGEFPLEVAVRAKEPDLETIKLLINSGALVESASRHDGNTPLHIAVRATPPNLELIQLLANKKTLSTVNINGNTPLHLAIRASRPNLKVIQLLIDPKSLATINHNGNSPLHTAIIASHDDVIEFLIKNGADLTIVDNDGESPLHVILRDSLPNRKILQLLIDSGADLKATDKEGNTPLHTAIQVAHPDHKLIQFLIECGADLTAINNAGNTPLHTAIQVLRPDHGLIQLLIESGADLTAIDKEGNTPLHIAIQTSPPNHGLIQFLIDSGADLNIINNEGISCSWLLKSYGITEVLVPSMESIEQFAEYELRRLLANNFSLKTFSSIKGKEFLLTGGIGSIGQAEVSKLLQEFQAQTANFLNLEEACTTIENGAKKATGKPEKIAKQFAKGKTLIFSTGWTKHSIQVIFIGDYMLVSNRGKGRQNASIKTFKINRQNPLTLENIERLQKGNKLLDLNEGKKFFYENLPASLGYDASNQDLISQVMEENCVQSNQKMGNCWWLNPKSGVLGIVTIQALLKASSQTYESEKERKKAYENIFDSSEAIYKYFSEFTKIQLLKKYVERPTDSAERDHKLVKLAVDKYYSKEKKYVVRTKGYAEQAYDILNKLLGRKVHEKLPPLYTHEDIEDWLNTYRKNYDLDEDFNPSDDPEPSLRYLDR